MHSPPVIRRYVTANVTVDVAVVVDDDDEACHSTIKNSNGWGNITLKWVSAGDQLESQCRYFL